MSAEDRAEVRRALERCDAWSLRDRLVETLSGGEWQRVRVARALAQQPNALVLDEPATALDIRHEMEVMELVRNLVKEGLACLLITHHLNLAARYADRMALLDAGPAGRLRRPDRGDAARGPDPGVRLAGRGDRAGCGAPQLVPLQSPDR